MVVNVANVPDGSQWVGEGTGAFSIDVPRNVPFVLQGWEYSQAELPSGRGYEQTLHRVMQQEFPATSEDIAGMEMDFAANEVTMATADVSVLMPTRGESRLRSGRAVALVCENDSYACIGWASRAEITADRSRIEASLLFAEPDWVEDEDVFGLYGAYADGNESVSRAIVYGWPTDGALDDVRLLDLPEVIVPATPTTRHPLATPFVWELHETGVEVGVLLLRDETTVWMIIPPPDGTTATAPRLPSTTSTAGLLGTGVVQGVLRILRRDTVASGPLVRVAQPRSFIVVP
jgi:hypothetical protein